MFRGCASKREAVYHPALQHRVNRKPGATRKFSTTIAVVLPISANSPAISMTCGTVAFLPLFVGHPGIVWPRSHYGAIAGGAGREGR